MSMTTITLAADDISAGLGHIARCTALARALREQAVEVQPLALGAVDPFVRSGVEWLPVTGSPRATNLLVVDSYRATFDELKPLIAGLVAVFHDGGHRTLPADLYIGLSVDEAVSGRWLAGAEFACLDPAYAEPPGPPPRGEVTRVLVAGGASAAGERSDALASALATRLGPRANVALARPGLTDPPPGVTAVVAAEGLRPALLSADLAVLPAGQALLEAAAAGRASVAWVAAENQEHQASLLGVAGATVVARHEEEVLKMASELVGDAARRDQIARAGRAAIDGRGAARLAEALISLAATKSQG